MGVSGAAADHRKPKGVRIERVRIIRGERSREVVHAVTSLRRDEADAWTLLKLSRDHWRIENRLHCVRDVTFDEVGHFAEERAQAVGVIRYSTIEWHWGLP